MGIRSLGARGAASAAVAVAVALAAVPALAFAEPASIDGQTAVKLYHESGQVTVQIPVEIPVAIGEDGSFITADNAAFVNEGVAALHVAKVGVTPSNGINLVHETAYAATKDESTVWSSVAPGAGQKLDLSDYTVAKAPFVPTQWNIAGNGKLSIKLDGAMKNPSEMFKKADSASTAPLAYTIVWTVAHGPVQP